MPRDGTRYLVIDDPLPSIFEAVNTDFASQAGRRRGGNGTSRTRNSGMTGSSFS